MLIRGLWYPPKSTNTVPPQTTKMLQYQSSGLYRFYDVMLVKRIIIKGNKTILTISGFNKVQKRNNSATQRIH